MPRLNEHAIREALKGRVVTCYFTANGNHCVYGWLLVGVGYPPDDETLSAIGYAQDTQTVHDVRSRLRSAYGMVFHPSLDRNGVQAIPISALCRADDAIRDAKVTELQGQLTAAQSRAAALSAAVTDLEASVSELDRRVLDLAGGDIQRTRPEVEAAVAIVRQRAGEVRQASSGVVQSLASD